MKFDRVIRSILKEDEDSSTVHVTGGRLLTSGKLLNDKDYDKAFPGTVPEVMIDVLEDVTKRYGKSVEDCESIQILVDDVDSPVNCNLFFGWGINANLIQDRVVFSYRGVDTKVTDLYKHLGTHNISLDHLRKLQQNKLMDNAMKGHELEDLYNL